MSSLSEFRLMMYRRLKYRIRRPLPPRVDQPFKGPVVVAGSAPISNKPAGFDDTYSIITINGSYAAVAPWGVKKPAITFLQFNQIYGTNTNAVEVRRVLKSQKTGSLFVFLWRKNDQERLVRGLEAFDFSYDKLTIVDRYERMALLDRVVGLRTLEMDAESKCSNGINAVLFALYNGANAVIMTGINPDSAGHAYNAVGLPRLHVQTDKRVILSLLESGLPIYTADAHVSEGMGIPMWTGHVG